MTTKEESEMIKEVIRKNLIKLRAEKGVTQTDVGLATGKSKNAVASWEQGLSLPDAPTLYLLSKYYNKSMDYFYEDHSIKKYTVTIKDLDGKEFNSIVIPTDQVSALFDGKIQTVSAHRRKSHDRDRLREVIKTPDVERGVVNDKKNQSS